LGRAARAQQVLELLREVIPQPNTELRYDDVYQLLIAVILSAQCTDERVNMVTPALFEAFPTVEDLAEAHPDDIYPYIKSVTFPNNKAGYLAKMARRVVEEYNGEIPRTQSKLQTLSGVGRKTAQVVINVAHNAEALPVDTHVFRVANRIGLVKEDADTPLKVERQLKRIIPRSDWGDAHHLLILHGRYTCTARRPSCDECPLTGLCKHFQRLQRLPEPLDGLDSSQGRYYCQTDDHYFDEPALRVDRYGIEQVACPWSGSMNVYDARTGRSTKKIPDYRVNGETTATARKGRKE
jgi:endonuclease-3